MIFRAINDSPCSDTGVAPSFFVYGFSQNTGGGARGSMIKPANIMCSCTQQITLLNARRAVRDGKRNRNTPSHMELDKVRCFPPRHGVLINREKEGRTWYTLVRVRDHEIDAVLPGRTVSTFAINMVEPYHTAQTEYGSKGQSKIAELNGERLPRGIKERKRHDNESAKKIETRN